MASDRVGTAVETVIRGALHHLGQRVVLPAAPPLSVLELTACVRIMGCGEPEREFTSSSQLGKCCEDAPQGTLILFLMLRFRGPRRDDDVGLTTEALLTAWGDREMGPGVEMPGGYRGWIGPLPAHWLSRVCA